MDTSHHEPMYIQCKCGQPVDITDLASATEAVCPVCGEINTLAPNETAALNNRINRKIAESTERVPAKDALRDATKGGPKPWAGADHRAVCPNSK